MYIIAQVILDSITPEGNRITTISVNMPKFLIAQLNTHRALVKNSGSSRAVPVTENLKHIKNMLVTPKDFGLPANASGMVPKEALTGFKAHLASLIWLSASKFAAFHAYLLSKLNLHKAWTNRVIEPYMYTHVVITATDWDNFFNLRIHKDAQDAMMVVASSIKKALTHHVPIKASIGAYHLPFIGLINNPTQDQIDISVSCLAQTSYRALDDGTHKAKRVVNKLLGDTPHWSPFEHVAVYDLTESGSFKGWHSYRHIKEEELNASSK